MAAEPSPAIHIEVADRKDAQSLAELAAQTFPLACPPGADPRDIAAFIRENLDAAAFGRYLADGDVEILVARTSQSPLLVGYCLSRYSPPTDPQVASVITDAAVEVSKLYVLPTHHSAASPAASPARLLMTTALQRAVERGTPAAWLGVNQENVRAQKFYRKMGFTPVGVRTFNLNGSIEHDFVLRRELTSAGV